MKRWLLPCAKLFVAAILIYWLIGRGGLPLAELSGLEEGWPWLLLAQVPYAMVLLLAALRWHLLLRVQGILYSFREVYSLVLMGIFFNQVLFGSTGGDVIKAYYVARESSERRAAAALTVFIDRAIGLFVLMSIACAATFFNFPLLQKDPNLWNLAVFVWIAVGGALAVTGIFYLWAGKGSADKKAGIIKKFTQILYLYRSHPGVAVKALLISALLHALVVITNLLLLRSLLPQEWASLPALFLVVPLAQIVMAIPVTPGAIGTAEVAYDWLFKLVGFPVKGALVSLLQRLTYCIWAIPGLVIYLKNRRVSPETGPPAEEPPGGDCKEEAEGPSPAGQTES